MSLKTNSLALGETIFELDYLLVAYPKIKPQIFFQSNKIS